MARGDTPPLDGEPDDGPAKQREILAQFEAAIAEMRTRDIQIGLRQLLAAARPARPFKSGPDGSHGGDRPDAQRHRLDER